MVSEFHGADEASHEAFQAWRRANPDGFHMTEKGAGTFVVHYTQDKRENSSGRGCIHQGTSGVRYLEDKGGCYTMARKVCSRDLGSLLSWADQNGFVARRCKHCDTRRFPFDKYLEQSSVSASRLVIREEPLLEGAVRVVELDAYERNPEARRRCLSHHGTKCSVCDFSFESIYGEIAAGFIHVHHLRPLSEAGAEHVVDPIRDLRPVCPNCHAVIHLGGGCRSIEEMRGLLRLRPPHGG